MTSGSDRLTALLELLPEGEAADRDILEVEALLLRSAPGSVRFLTDRLSLEVSAAEVVGIDGDVDRAYDGTAIPVRLGLRRGFSVRDLSDGLLVAEVVATDTRPFSVAIRTRRPRGPSTGHFRKLEGRFLQRNGLLP